MVSVVHRFPILAILPKQYLWSKQFSAFQYIYLCIVLLGLIISGTVLIYLFLMPLQLNLVFLFQVDDGNGCTATKLEMNQTGLGKGIHACLPDLVTLIHDIFQSTSCSSITKEELVHKIIMSNCDIMERSAYEWSQLNLCFSFCNMVT